MQYCKQKKQTRTLRFFPCLRNFTETFSPGSHQFYVIRFLLTVSELEVWLTLFFKRLNSLVVSLSIAFSIFPSFLGQRRNSSRVFLMLKWFLQERRVNTRQLTQEVNTTHLSYPSFHNFDVWEMVLTFQRQSELEYICYILNQLKAERSTKNFNVLVILRLFICCSDTSGWC